ncbi:MAG: VTT domain-containing protein [Candidatus Pacebacteria bacterium]|nr:VTT domain-containing protein [Candidatus Paceibacterota bacterium]
MDLHILITSFSYLAIFILMITNGAFNLPSSQFLYLICGYFISTGNLLFIPTLIAGATGNTLGNILTFLLVKKYKKGFARKILMMDEVTFDKLHKALHDTFLEKGMWYIFFGKITPSIKAFIPILAGLSNTNTKITSFIFLITSSIWAVLILSLGYFFGEQFSLQSFAGVSLLVGLTISYIVYKKISKKLA